jgi:hypothetical protein
MEAFGIIAVSLLSIQIILLFMLMNIQTKCSTKERINNPWAHPRRVALGGIPLSANSVVDTPGIEDTLLPGGPEDTLMSTNNVLEQDPLADPNKKATLSERLTNDMKSNSSYSLDSVDDNYTSEVDKEKSRAGKTVYDKSGPQDGDPGFRSFKGANHFSYGDPSNTNILNSKERFDNKTDGLLYENHITWDKGQDLKKYRERLQMNRVGHLDPYPELDSERRPIVFKKDLKSEYAHGEQQDPTIDNVSIEYILSEPRSNLRY